MSTWMPTRSTLKRSAQFMRMLIITGVIVVASCGDGDACRYGDGNAGGCGGCGDSGGWSDSGGCGGSGGRVGGFR